MYEIWLAMNIVYEIALSVAPWLAVLLLVWLVLRGGPNEALRSTSGTLLQHLSLMFVPAGTGVMSSTTRPR